MMNANQGTNYLVGLAEAAVRLKGETRSLWGREGIEHREKRATFAGDRTLCLPSQNERLESVHGAFPCVLNARKKSDGLMHNFPLSNSVGSGSTDFFDHWLITSQLAHARYNEHGHG